MDLSQPSYIMQTQPSATDHSNFDADNYLTTPKEHSDNQFKFYNAVVSPKRKKRETESFYESVAAPVFSSQVSQHGSQFASNEGSNFQLRLPVQRAATDRAATDRAEREVDNSISAEVGHGMFLSQDDTNLNSQMSQTDHFAYRFGEQLSVQGGGEDSRVEINTNSNISHLCYDNHDLVSNDGFQTSQSAFTQPAPLTTHKEGFQIFPKHKASSSIVNKENIARVNSKGVAGDLDSREVKVAPPVQNPFLAPEARAAKIGPRSIWVQSFQERSRYTSDFHQESVLGQGASSAVYCARCRIDGILYAVKKVHDPVSNDPEKRQVQNEVCAHAALQGCPYIVQYFNSWIDDNHLYIQTELCALGTLDSLVEQTYNRLQGSYSVNNMSRADSFDHTGSVSRPASLFSLASDRGRASSQVSVTGPAQYSQDSNSLTTSAQYDFSGGPSLAERTMWIVLSRMAAAVHFMHNRGVAHMDIRPANMFISSNNHFIDMSSNAPTATSNGGFMNPHPLYRQKSVNLNVPADKLKRMIVKGECGVKLGDFGLARRLDQNKPGTIEEGESRYCARELINGTGLIDLKSADVFSLGATIYELMLGRQLGAGGEAGSIEWHSIRDGQLDEDLVRSGLFSPTLFSLVKRMVDPNPQCRPCAQEVAVTADSFLAAQPPIAH